MWLSRITSGCVAAVLLLCIRATATRAEAPAPVVANVRDFGAIGDGTVHSVNEWVKANRYASLRAIQKDFPFVESLGWSIDEVAFERAKRSLPVSGGTIYFPAGYYIAAKSPWRILRDDVRLAGDGADRTILSTAPGVPEGLVLAPYRHGGWMEGARREYPFTADSGKRGDDGVVLKDAAWADDFQEGEIVFIRNGANRFDQDYGEFNEIASVDPDGHVHFKHPLARDYTLERVNWAGEIEKDFKMPEVGRSVRVALRHGEGFFRPGTDATVSVGDAIFHVEKTGLLAIHLENPGRGNPPPGTIIRAGTKVAAARAIIKVTATVRNFRCEKLQVIGHRKVLNLSNSYDSAFTDCTFMRDTRNLLTHGGLTIDGDDGRFARFERCKVIATPPAGMQFARSFGDVSFTDCTFTDANVAFTEFNFGCQVVRCTFEVRGGPNLNNVIIAGKSCGDLEFLDNHIQATNVATVFDTASDIQSQKHASEGAVLVRGNTIETSNVPALFAPARPARFTIEANRTAKR